MPLTEEEFITLVFDEKKVVKQFIEQLLNQFSENAYFQLVG